MKQYFNTILCLFFIAIGLLITITVAILSFQKYHFVKTASSARGIVSRQTSGPSHLAVIFTASNGEKIEYLQNGFVLGNVGEEVEVIYNPENPHEASFNTFWALWGDYTMLLLIGLAFVLLPILKLLYPETKWISWNF